MHDSKPTLSLTSTSTSTRATTALSIVQQLPAGAAHTLHCVAGTVLTVVAGRLWITQSGALEDHFLTPGQSLQVGHGRLVIEADTQSGAQFHLTQPSPRKPRTPLLTRSPGSPRMPHGPSGPLVAQPT